MNMSGKRSDTLHDCGLVENIPKDEIDIIYPTFATKNSQTPSLDVIC